MPYQTTQTAGSVTSPLATAQGLKVLKNTYLLLSMTLLFSAVMAVVSMTQGWPHLGLMTLLVYAGLFFATYALRNSAWGLVSVFALTGFLGATLGPMLNAYLTTFSNGGQLIALALGGTGVVFLSMSAIALLSKKDFSFMGKALMIGIITAFIGGLAAYFFQIPALSLAVSGMFILLMSGLILYETQMIVRGGETNYIMATVTLYVSIYNLFVSLLNILGLFGEE